MQLKQESREWVIIENGGQKIFGVLHRPGLIDNPPIVVIFHGFASSKHGFNRCYVLLAERLAQEGIATLRFDFRGSGDSEGRLSEMTFEDLVSDAVAVLKYVPSLTNIDPTRIALFGSSLGGSLSVVAASQVGKIKALVLWAPVASGELWYKDFVQQNPHTLHAYRDSLLSTYRGIQLHPQFRMQFAQMEIYKLLPQLHLPTLHMHGEKDTIVSVSHQQAFWEECRESPQVKFMQFPDGEHSLGFSPSFPDVVEHTVNWLHTYL